MDAAMEQETIEIARDLIRIESVNTGDPATIGDGEERAARYVRDRLDEVGISGEFVLPTPGRGSLVVRIPGRDRSAGALLVHAHLDVVPVDAADWSVPPFAAEIREDDRHGEMLYGRGAVDMKGFAAMVVAVARAGLVPRRDLVLAFLADEEAGGVWGAKWLVENRPELFAGVTEAIGEVGGFSVPLPTAHDGVRRAYLLATAEKGAGWARLRARGAAGHASQPGPDTAVLRLARAVAALGEHRFPVEHTDATRPFHAAFSALTGQDGVPELAAAGLRHSAVPTMLAAGYKLNVIPGEAIAEVDTRVVPGGEEEFRREVERVVGEDVSVEWVLSNAPVVSPVDGPLVQTVREAVAHDDPDGVVVPYLLAASTDNKNFSRLGIAGYGFTPLRVPAGFDAFGQFHAVDERVPLAALRFGARVLRRILQTA
ncbi:MAG TPA: M20/M25/M40 family metallo-hydrolase [Pseudonocardia sp.]|jgi:acetylornithine deacetylase/succinyl-diaminopimelate desuccinylase-like protein|nr:M20/M25/M40 family metallo-hydrolase [Pseudonocardia sp.]